MLNIDYTLPGSIPLWLVDKFERKVEAVNGTTKTNTNFNETLNDYKQEENNKGDDMMNLNSDNYDKTFIVSIKDINSNNKNNVPVVSVQEIYSRYLSSNGISKLIYS